MAPDKGQGASPPRVTCIPHGVACALAALCGMQSASPDGAMASEEQGAISKRVASARRGVGQDNLLRAWGLKV